MVSGDTVLIFACDEAFVPLAKGLVLSIQSQALPAEFSLKMIDIGCSNETLQWMESRQVSISKFNYGDFSARAPRTKMKNYQQAQLCRPFLPKLFPGYEVYVWCDSDIWIQNIESLRLYRDIAKSNKKIVPISPLVDVSYNYFYQDCTEFVTYSKHWFENAYGRTVAEGYGSRAVLSSGIFAMHTENDLWGLWASELDAIFQRDFASHFSVHLAEQTAFNYLLYAHQRFCPVDAMHNYNCHVGRIGRDEFGDVVISDAPHRKLGVVHLTYSSKMMGDYLDQGLLYEKAQYLSPQEIEKLRSLNHY